MEIASIATITIPFLIKGIEAFSQAAGEKAAEKLDEFCSAIKAKFKGDSYAAQTLARAKEEPESEERIAALKGVIIDKLDEDSSFAEQMGQLIKELEIIKEGTAIIAYGPGSIAAYNVKNSTLITGKILPKARESISDKEKSGYIDIGDPV
jgi:hypothetical protein